METMIRRNRVKKRMKQRMGRLLNCTYFMLIFYINFSDGCSRKAAIASFKNNVKRGGEEKRDIFGTVIDNKTVYLEDLESTSLSTR
jgi:hypothetical protein